MDAFVYIIRQDACHGRKRMEHEPATGRVAGASSESIRKRFLISVFWSVANRGEKKEKKNKPDWMDWWLALPPTGLQCQIKLNIWLSSIDSGEAGCSQTLV